MKVYVNLPVKNLEKSKEFFSKLNFEFNEKFTDEKCGCMIVGGDNYVMLLTEEFFRTFTGKELSDATKATEVIVALEVENREKVDEGEKEALAHLGYPEYDLTIFGVAKILGSIAVLQPKFRTIKEWAYAGFTINFIGAFASHAFVGDGIGMLIPPIITLVIMFISYFLWKKIEAANLQTI